MSPRAEGRAMSPETAKKRKSRDWGKDDTVQFQLTVTEPTLYLHSRDHHVPCQLDDADEAMRFQVTAPSEAGARRNEEDDFAKSQLRGKCEQSLLQPTSRSFGRDSVFSLGGYSDIEVDPTQAPGLWRAAEARRRTLHQKFKSSVMGCLFDVFHAWQQHCGLDVVDSRKRKHVRTDDIETSEDLVLGGRELLHDMPLKQMVSNISMAETFYETRIASAERLIGFFVMFHSMVKPLSKLPFLNFDMDRTASRLRVASTPAPVAMHDRPPKE